MAFPRRRQIAILIDPGDTWGRQVITGILSAVRNILPWDLLIAPRDNEWRFRLPRNWHGDGIIGAMRDEKTARHIIARGLPTINVSSWGSGDWGWHRVNSDDEVRASMAFHHFRERGFEHFAYYGPHSPRYSVHRGDHFQKVVRDHEFSFTMFPAQASQSGWSTLGKQTLQWLKQSPWPLAVFAADPHPALRLTEICSSAGIRVPEDVAILAGDTDELLCAASDPPLSSIVLASHQIGVESVHLLRRLLDHEPIANSPICIPPLGTIDQHSTDVLAVNDPQFVQALRFIRENAHLGIDVPDVVRITTISRRLLEQRFYQHLKRTPAEEIRRIKLDRVKQLLISTDRTLDQIAIACGYSSVSHLCFSFRKVLQQSPQEFRRLSRRTASHPS